jgi:hypothetical protein
MADTRRSVNPEPHPVVARAVAAVVGATVAVACAGAAFLVFNLFTGASAGGELGAFFTDMSLTAGGLLGADERVAMIFLPLLILGTLLLGGLWLWNKRS